MTYTVNLTRGLDIESGCIDGRCRTSSPCKSSFNSLSNFVQSDNKNNLLWAPCDCCHTIAVTVDVHDDSILGYGIGTAQIDISRKCLEIHGLLVLWRFRQIPVENFQSASIVQYLWYTKVANCHRAAPRHTAPIVDELGNLLHSLGCRGTIEGLDVAMMKIMNGMMLYGMS